MKAKPTILKNNDNNVLDSLEKERISTLVLKYSLPSLAIIAVSGSYNIIDGIFLGRSLGIEANSINSYVFLLYMVIFSFTVLISQGSSTILTIYLGEKNNKKAESVIGVSVWLSLVFAFLLSICIKLCLRQIVILLQIDHAYSIYFTNYFNVFLIFSPIYFLSHTLIYILRAQGKVFFVMWLSLLSFFVNLLLGYLLIILFDWGFTGSSLATIGANLLSCIICLFYMIGKRNVRLKSSEIRWNLKVSSEIIRTGLPQLLLNLASVLLLLIYNTVARNYAGTFGIAALSIGSSIYRYITLVMNAITSGIQPIIGYNYGAQNYNRVRKTLNFTFVLASVVSIILAVVIQINANKIIGYYNYNDLAFNDFAVIGTRLVLLALPLQGLISISVSYFQNIKKTKWSVILVILRQVIFQVPLALVLPCFFNIVGLWHSFWISDVMITVVSLFFLKKNRAEMKGY